jgi:sarcosine oxidase subunit alpha
VDQTYRSFLWLNAQWRMKIDILNVTSAISGMNIAGPKSRLVLERLGADFDLSAEAFPYLEARMGKVAGIPVRVIRVGFVGELGYELHVPTPYALALWNKLMDAGQDEGIVPFGVEAQRVLRLEKGHIIVGQDTDGLTHPFEAGLDWAMPKNKTDYIGRAAVIHQMERGLKRRLVGFKLDDARTPAPGECCLVLRKGAIAGRVTSAVYSEACGGVIGLAYVAPEDVEPGSQLTIKNSDGRILKAHVVPTPFYDPKHERQAL